MALAWVLRNPKMTSTLISTSKVEQLEENIKALDHLVFSEDELIEIDHILNKD
jgi:L-glyceraldehyde 3-phosphate reductase